MKTLLHDFITQLNEQPHSEHEIFHTLFQNLIEKAPIGIYILEDDSYLYVNSYYADMLGYEKEEFTQGHFTVEQTIHPEDYPRVIEKINNRMVGHGDRYRLRKKSKNGTLIYTEIQSYMEGICGKRIFFGSVLDITEQLETLQRLEESNEKYKSLFESSPDAIFSIDEVGYFVDVNHAAGQLVGYSIKELIGMPFMTVLSQEDLPEAMKLFEEAKAGKTNSTEFVLVRKDNQRIHVHSTHFPMRVNGKIVGTYGIARDITHKKLYDEQMRKLAFYDPLTKLPNRKLFEDRLGQIANLAKNDGMLFSVIFLDLDRFKIINDSLGHHVGDELLKMVAERLQQTIRKTDTLSRLAGDEFTILVPDCKKEDVIRLAERIIQIMSEPFQVSGHTLSVVASIGIAFSTGIGEDVHEIIRHADTAMYQTKKYRRSEYTIYCKEMDKDANYKLTIERDLPLAVKNNELELYYQPIIDLKNEQVLSMEALIRWHHPTLGMIPPNDFIRVAEESGHIILIGAWVLETACSQNKKWQDSGFKPFKVGVNVSTKQLQQVEFVDTVKEVLTKTGLEPKWLDLEVTESILLDDVDIIKEILLKLKELGVSISIDDFGTGYTSLSYLRKYPFDKVKIDKSFIDDISKDLNGKRITSAIISLAHSLQMEVVAEGIETDTELLFLKEEKCDGGQGYLFSKPMPVQSLSTKWLK